MYVHAHGLCGEDVDGAELSENELDGAEPSENEEPEEVVLVPVEPRPATEPAASSSASLAAENVRGGQRVSERMHRLAQIMAEMEELRELRSASRAESLA